MKLIRNTDIQLLIQTFLFAAFVIGLFIVQ